MLTMRSSVSASSDEALVKEFCEGFGARTFQLRGLGICKTLLRMLARGLCVFEPALRQSAVYTSLHASTMVTINRFYEAAPRLVPTARIRYSFVV